MNEERYFRTLGIWIRRQRARLGLTQAELAEAIGLRRATVAAWESGERTVNAYQLWRLKRLMMRRADHAVDGAHEHEDEEMV